MIRRTTKIDDQAANNKSNDEHDLQGSEENFCLAVETNSAEVHKHNEDQEYCDPDSRVDRIIPELDQDGCSTYLCWYSNCYSFLWVLAFCFDHLAEAAPCVITYCTLSQLLVGLDCGGMIMTYKSSNLQLLRVQVPQIELHGERNPPYRLKMQ